jgi:hypothetical protein
VRVQGRRQVDLPPRAPWHALAVCAQVEERWVGECVQLPVHVLVQASRWEAVHGCAAAPESVVKLERLYRCSSEWRTDSFS